MRFIARSKLALSRKSTRDLRMVSLLQTKSTSNFTIDEAISWIEQRKSNAYLLPKTVKIYLIDSLVAKYSETQHLCVPMALGIYKKVPSKRSEMPHTTSTLSPSKPSSSVGWRSIAIGIILIPLNCYWITYIELVQYSAQPTIVSLIFTVVFNVLVLLGLNQILKRFLPRLALSQGELLVIYVMLSVASATAGHSMMEILVSTLGHAFWFATPENDWKDLFWRYIPSWLAVADKGVLSGYYEGDSTLHTKQHLLGWLTPVLNWSAFLFVMLFVMVCITVIVRRPWTEDEKLAYPIIQLPARMTSEGFFTNRLMWIAFGLTVALDVVNGLHHVFPAIPSVYEKAYRFRFTEKPFSAMGWLRLGIYPFVLGIGFLIPLDLLFSTWFFFWVWKGQQVIGSVMGLEGTGYPYVNYQGFGAYMGIFLIAVWRSRKHLQNWLGAKDPSTSTRDEPVSPIILVLALIAGAAFLIFFSLRAGMSLWAILVFLWTLLCAFSTAVSRMRAELGSPMHDLHYTGPERDHGCRCRHASAGTE